MKQVLLVTKETYLRQVKSWAFLMMVLSPFLFLGIFTGIGYLTGSSSFESDKVAVVLSDNQLTKAFKGLSGTTLSYKTEKAAQAAQKDEAITGYVLVETSSDQVKATYHGDTSLEESVKDNLLSVLGGLQNKLNMAKANLSPEQIASLAKQPVFQEKIAEKGDLKKLGKYIAFFGLTMVMYVIILTYASQTAQEIASEKGTKIMEVIFSSVPANRYFYGRILGIFAVITTHIGIYAIGGVLAFKWFQERAVSKEMMAFLNPMLEAVFANLDWTMVFLALFGILLYVVLAALCGSIVVRAEDVNKAVQPVVYVVIVGFIGAMSLGQQGHDNLILAIGSYLPFLSSFFMPIRLINGYAGSLEAIISLVILAATTVLATLYIGRSYAGLILQTDDIGLFNSLKRGFSHR
ncbi:ABC transporter permease [Streptococcus suis]|nr:ABC transporter permease [Streptococcus suis]